MATRTKISGRHKPAFLFPDCYACSSYSIYRRGSIPSGEKHIHDIVLKGNTLTVDGHDHGKIDDLQNASFMESLLNSDLPDEFDEEGLHVVEILRLPDFGPTTPEEWLHEPEESVPMMNNDPESDEGDFDVIFDSDSDSD